MAKPRVAVLTGDGINCDMETQEAFEAAFSKATAITKRVFLDDLKDRAHEYQIIAMPGGFSFGDDISAGKVFAVKMKTALHDEIHEFIERGGLMIGICNGAQIGVKLPLPGFSKRGRQSVTLAYNSSGRFQCEWVRLKSTSPNCLWTRGLDELELPIAHGEGRFYARDRSVLDRMYEKNQVALKYAGYNPNGSMDDIAGVCDPSGRTLLLMPHPERYIHPYQHPQWTRQRTEGRLPSEGSGMQIFRNAANYFM